MNQMANLPIWATLLVVVFLIIGASLALIGSFGLYRLRSFYDRIHASTLGTSWGTAGIIVASIVYFSVVESELVLRQFLVGAFIIIVGPIALVLLGRAALYRDRAASDPEAPLLEPSINPAEAQPTDSQKEPDV
jgi:multicomponent K+:H+ antiporter subunit G